MLRLVEPYIAWGYVLVVCMYVCAIESVIEIYITQTWINSLLVCVFFFLNLVMLFIFSYRYPNLKTTRELIYKRGYGKVDRRRTPLTDNSVVEEVRERSTGYLPANLLY